MSRRGSIKPRPYRIGRKDNDGPMKYDKTGAPMLSGECRSLTDEELAEYERELLERDASLRGKRPNSA